MKSRLIQNHNINNLKIVSSSLALIGGVLLANNIEISKYGFIFLAASSSSMSLAGYLSKDNYLLIYSLVIFLFVDCLGVYNWVIK